MPTWDLEYMLLFGPPENKLELLDGKTPCSFPFADRGSADAHFALWASTLARWQGVADPPGSLGGGQTGQGVWQVHAGAVSAAHPAGSAVGMEGLSLGARLFLGLRPVAHAAGGV